MAAIEALMKSSIASATSWSCMVLTEAGSCFFAVVCSRHCHWLTSHNGLRSCGRSDEVEHG